MTRPQRRAPGTTGVRRKVQTGTRGLPAIAREIQAAFRDGRLPARLTVTTIILLAMLGGLEITPPAAWVMFAYLVLSAAGIHLAGAYGEVIGREFGRREPGPDGDFRSFLVERTALASFGLWSATACVFAICAFGVISLATAFVVAQIGLVGLLFGLGFLSRYLNGRPLRKCLWGGTSVALIRFLLSDLRLLVDLVRTV